MEKESDDVEQVFIIDDTNEPSSKNIGRIDSNDWADQYDETSDHDIEVAKRSITGGLVSILTVICICLFVFFIGSYFKMSSKQIVNATIILIFVPLLFILILFGLRKGNVYASEKTKQKRKSNRSKFKNYKEYRNSKEFELLEAEENAKLTNEELTDKLEREKVQLAIDALCSMGMKAKRATHLVSMALDSGIKRSETQMLIKHALQNRSNN